MPSSLLSTAVSGLLAFQRSLETTSHNIANVGTEGYSRQRANFGTRSPDFIGDTFIGNGVQVNSITRAYDQFLTAEVRDTSSSFEKNRLTQELAGYVDNVLADPFGGISPVLQEFFACLLADCPLLRRSCSVFTASSLPERLKSHTKKSAFLLPLGVCP